MTLQDVSQALTPFIERNEWEGKLFFVGGCVRDELLGLGAASDIDIVVQGNALELGEQIFAAGACEHPPVTYPRFGTVALTIKGIEIELASARKESYDPDSRKPGVSTASLYEDALRRDFTVNALMRDVFTLALQEHIPGSLSDLENKVLRTPTDPNITMSDDPLRMLRAVRIAHQLGFSLAPGLVSAIQVNASRLEIISVERIREEFDKMLLRENASSAIRQLSELKLLGEFLPELEQLKGVEQNGYHHLDVWDHTLGVLDSVPNGDLTLKWAALLHDISKPETQTHEPDGRIRFLTHEVLGADKTELILNRLRYDHDTIAAVKLLVRNHMRFSMQSPITPKAARRLVRDLGGQLDKLLELCKADTMAMKPELKIFDPEPIRNECQRALAAGISPQMPSPLDGPTIMRIANLHPGPPVGAIKNWLLELVLDGELEPDDSTKAMQLLAELVQDETKFNAIAFPE